MLPLYGSIAGISKIVSAFGWREGIKDLANRSPSVGDGSRLGLPHEVFELGEELFNRIEIWTIGRQEEEVCAGLSDGVTNSFSFVAAKIVEDHDVTATERRDEDLLHIEGEELTIDWSIDDPGGIDAIDPKRSDEGEGFPMTVGDASLEALTARAPAA
jgi:hypothetical protein